MEEVIESNVSGTAQGIDADIEALANATVPGGVTPGGAGESGQVGGAGESGHGGAGVAGHGGAGEAGKIGGAGVAGRVGEGETGQEVAEGDAKAEDGAKAADLSAENELFERGIRAGIPMKELLELPTHAMAERMVTLAEKANGISQPNKGETDGVEADADDNWGAAIEEMENDGEYDPKILRVLKGLQKENARLKSARETADKQGFFESQVGSLDKAVRTKLDAVRLSQLRSKYDVLEAGYRASGSKITQGDIFQEAARLALGDLMGKAAEERKAAALEQRKNLTLARPGGENGQTRGGVPADDPFADFVAALG